MNTAYLELPTSNTAHTTEGTGTGRHAYQVEDLDLEERYLMKVCSIHRLCGLCARSRSCETGSEGQHDVHGRGSRQRASHSEIELLF